MTTEELILPYKLEQHLTEICNSSATYKIYCQFGILIKKCVRMF